MPAVVVAGPVYAVLRDSSGNDLGIVDIGGIKHLQAEVNRIVSELPAGTQIIGKVGIDAANLGGLAEEGTLSAVATDIAAIEVLLTSIDGKDFATNTTLGTLLSEASFVSRTGEVTASPAANTVLGRLKAITDLITAGNVDLAAIEVLLTSLDGKDYATQTTLDVINTKTPTVGQKVMAGSRPVVIASDQSEVAGKNAASSQVDGHSLSIGATTDTDSANTVIGRLKQLLTRTGEVQATPTTNTILDRLKQAQDVLVGSFLTDALRVRLYDSLGNALSTQLDAGTRRLEVAGKVVVVGAAPPPATNDATIFASTPLVVGSHDTVFVIPNLETFHLQEVVAGNEDPTKGCSIEVIFDENGTEHLVARIYRAGVTETEGFPNRTTARDGTVMLGNAGGTNRVIVRRIKYSGSDIAIDAVVRGYTVVL